MYERNDCRSPPPPHPLHSDSRSQYAARKSIWGGRLERGRVKHSAMGDGCLVPVLMMSSGCFWLVYRSCKGRRPNPHSYLMTEPSKEWTSHLMYTDMLICDAWTFHCPHSVVSCSYFPLAKSEYLSVVSLYDVLLLFICISSRVEDADFTQGW